MKLSTRSRYGMRAMLVLAMEYGRGPIMAKEIAEKQSIPVNYLEQLLVQLRKSRLVLSARGAHGGYMLARPPAKISLTEVMEVLEGPLELAKCHEDAVCGKQADTCVLKDLWANASQALAGAFAMSLDDLAEAQKRKLVTVDYSI